MNTDPMTDSLNDPDVPVFMADDALRLTPEEVEHYRRMTRRSATVSSFVNALIASGFTRSRLQEECDFNGLLPPLDPRNPKPDPAPVFISPADLPLALEPPLFMTKRASSDDFHRNCADIFHATPHYTFVPDEK